MTSDAPYAGLCGELCEQPTAVCRGFSACLLLDSEQSKQANIAPSLAQANVGDYEASARYYVRALSMNSRASNVWGYLRTSLAQTTTNVHLRYFSDSTLLAMHDLNRRTFTGSRHSRCSSNKAHLQDFRWEAHRQYRLHEDPPISNICTSVAHRTMAHL